MQLTPEQVDSFRTAFEKLQAVLSQLRPIYDATGSTQQNWPRAVPTGMIVKPGDRNVGLFRARQILEPIKKYLTGSKFLDYGCGEGWVAREAAQTADVAVGYDPADSEFWDVRDQDNLCYYSRLEWAAKRGPYNIILCHDVLDHTDRPQLEVLHEIIELLRPGGILQLVFHPWTARHGAHQYYDNNQAYWHLFTPEQEVRTKIAMPPFRALRPLQTYDALVKSSGLIMLDRQIENKEPEEFFNGEVLDAIITNTWGAKEDRARARKIMAIQHVDYILQRPLL